MTNESDGLPLAESPIEIVERIMTRHWDFVDCSCWICRSGRALRLAPRDTYLRHRQQTDPLGKLVIEEIESPK